MTCAFEITILSTFLWKLRNLKKSYMVFSSVLRASPFSVRTVANEERERKGEREKREVILPTETDVYISPGAPELE